MTLYEMIQESRRILPSEKFPERDEEIYRIIEDVFNIQKYQLFLDNTKAFSDDLVEKFFELVTIRSSGKPLAQVLGYSYFYQHKFPVSPQTLIPRYDTEHLVEVVRKNIGEAENILDICTGTGVIALSLHALFPEKPILALDIFDEPFLESQKYLGFTSDKVSFQKRDFLNKADWHELGTWDCIVSNPPYLDDHDMDVLANSVKDFEPHTALYGGKDGMIFYAHIAEFAEKYLKAGGFIVLEIDHKHQDVSNLFADDLYPYRELVCDYNDLPRVLLLRKV
ncbi:MAG: peptide chain release factor N(5)-glutamine methyltransferase [Brevinema sp.]